MKPVYTLNLFGWLLLASCYLSLASCGDVPTLDPPDVRWGQDVCVECGMILSDGRYASAAVAIQNGERQIYLYDDVGEMMAHPPKTKGSLKYWARDIQTQEWIDAATAYYVKSRDLHTPMGYGVVALADTQKAQELRDITNGLFLTFTVLSVPAARDDVDQAAPPHDHTPPAGGKP
jgi:copper chaperone NosL